MGQGFALQNLKVLIIEMFFIGFITIVTYYFTKKNLVKYRGK
jgi:hypothetical protein